jgi:hypothetical protein
MAKDEVLHAWALKTCRSAGVFRVKSLARSLQAAATLARSLQAAACKREWINLHDLEERIFGSFESGTSMSDCASDRRAASRKNGRLMELWNHVINMEIDKGRFEVSGVDGREAQTFDARHHYGRIQKLIDEMRSHRLCHNELEKRWIVGLKPGRDVSGFRALPIPQRL